jgi:hypothetical protein
MRIDRHLVWLLGVSVGTTLVATMPGRARADWGMGMGMGWGMFGVGPSASTSFLNQHAATRAAAGGFGRRTNNVYAGNSNAYFNRIRDNGFVSHYDARRRRSPSYQPERRTSLANATPAQPTATAPQPEAIEPLRRFFDASLKLVWPHDSPIDGDFREKREISDQASLAVLKETKQHGVATITSATEARQKLVEYGRPALKQLRAAATPPIADSFHRFILSLYDSLEAAATVANSAP